MKFVKRIVILDCCGERFSKVIDEWFGEDPVVGENISLSLFRGQLWGVIIKNILPAESPGNPYSHDVVFTKSEDENLFLCLCECLGDEKKGWFEREGAGKDLPTKY